MDEYPSGSQIMREAATRKIKAAMPRILVLHYHRPTETSVRHWREGHACSGKGKMAKQIQQDGGALHDSIHSNIVNSGATGCKNTKVDSLKRESRVESTQARTFSPFGSAVDLPTAGT